MGKASKWLMNFLLGRREDKGKKNNICICFEEHGSLVAIPSASPFRRIWRSEKSTTRSDARARKSSSSLDMKNQHVNTRVVSMATYEAFLTSKAIEDAAATRIQGAYRAYLARKALHALKGLVKLQALVRGHQVRKQTTSTLRCMHALMAIQVRARVQRIQTAAESYLTSSSTSRLSRYGGRFPLEMGFKRVQKDEQHGIVKSRDSFRNRSKTKMIEQSITRCYSEEISLPKRKQNHAEFSYSTHTSPRHCPPLKSKPRTPGRSSFCSYECPWTPGYMANTQSSMAKVRSQSEPKRRPAPDFKAKVVADENGELCFC